MLSQPLLNTAIQLEKLLKIHHYPSFQLVDKYHLYDNSNSVIKVLNQENSPVIAFHHDGGDFTHSTEIYEPLFEDLKKAGVLTANSELTKSWFRMTVDFASEGAESKLKAIVDEYLKEPEKVTRLADPANQGHAKDLLKILIQRDQAFIKARRLKAAEGLDNFVNNVQDFKPEESKAMLLKAANSIGEDITKLSKAELLERLHEIAKVAGVDVSIRGSWQDTVKSPVKTEIARSTA